MSVVSLGIVDAEPALLGGRRAATHAELEASVGQDVEHRDPLRHPGRMVHRRRDVEDPAPEVDVVGEGSDVRQERLVGRQMRVLREEVVLGRPRVLEPGAIGRNGPRDLVSEPIGLGVLGIEIAQLVGHVQRVEDAELHGSSESHGPTGCRPPPTLTLHAPRPTVETDCLDSGTEPVQAKCSRTRRLTRMSTTSSTSTAASTGCVPTRPTCEMFSPRETKR